MKTKVIIYWTPDIVEYFEQSAHDLSNVCMKVLEGYLKKQATMPLSIFNENGNAKYQHSEPQRKAVTAFLTTN